MCHFAERNLRTGRSHKQYAAQRIQVVAVIGEIANVDRVALSTFDSSSNVFTAHTGANRALNVAYSKAVPRGNCAVDRDIDIEALRDSFGENSACARNGAEYFFDLRTDL